MRHTCRLFAAVLIGFGALGTLGAMQPAQAGLLEFFFPSLKKKEPNLYETLQAPFADAPAPERKLTIEEVREARLPENNIPLEMAHRQPGQMSEITAELVSQVLMFQTDDYQQKLVQHKALFSPAGQAAYMEFLEKRNLIRVLESGKYKILSFVEDAPLVLNSAVADGRYRWLLEVPVTLSYMAKDALYSEGGSATNQRMRIRLQVGRHEESGNEHGVLIETWDATVQAVDRK